MSTVSVIQGANFYSSMQTWINPIPLSAGLIISTIIPALGKHISQNKTQWKWVCAVTTFGINFAIFQRFTPISTLANCFTSSILTISGQILADRLVTDRRKTYLNDPLGSSPRVLDAIFPTEPSYRDSYKQIFYFYVATATGFSLILYDSNPAGHLMKNFTHGCDPIGAVVDPMITDVHMRRVPDDLYAQIIPCMHRERGIPAFLAIQGVWTTPPVPKREITEDFLFSQLHETDAAVVTTRVETTPTRSNLLRLLSGKTKYEEYPAFDLQLATNTWRPMPQTPNLRGLSFKHCNEALVVWVHESNDQALGSAIQAAQRESRSLAGKINIEQRIIDSITAFLDHTIRRNTLLTRLPSAQTHNHSCVLIRIVRRKPQTESIDSEVGQIRDHAREYLGSMERRKNRVDQDLTELQRISTRLQAVQGNEVETQRILAETAERLPTSVAKPTLQVKQSTPANPETILHLKRKTLIEMRTIFWRYQRQLLPPSFAAVTGASTLMHAGKALLTDQASWISQNRQATTVIDMHVFQRDINHFLGNLTSPTWEQFEWLLQKLAEHNANFERMGTTEFLERNVAWLDQAIIHLFTLLDSSGKMDIEFEIEMDPIEKRLKLLGRAQPLYLTKRLSNTGHFLFDVSTNAQADPLARENDVHIEI
jgi:hypothetical protein